MEISCVAYIDSQLTHYVIVRQDLPVGHAAAQITHAAGESSPGHLPSGTVAVVLAANDVYHLEATERRLIDNGVEHSSIREPDYPYNGELVAIGVKPAHKPLVSCYFKDLKLYRGSSGTAKSNSPKGWRSLVPIQPAVQYLKKKLIEYMPG